VKNRAVAATALGVVVLWSLPLNAGAVSTQASDSGAARSSELGLPRIKGTVGPGHFIDVSRHQAPAGRYRLVVDDNSSSHNWHIKGPGVNRRTTVSGTGRTVWRVQFEPGTYRILCDAHPTTMRTRLVIS